jgi:hypothetical protein
MGFRVWLSPGDLPWFLFFPSSSHVAPKDYWAPKSRSHGRIAQNQGREAGLEKIIPSLGSLVSLSPDQWGKSDLASPSLLSQAA